MRRSSARSGSSAIALTCSQLGFNVGFSDLNPAWTPLVEHAREVSINYGSDAFKGKVTSAEGPCTRAQRVRVFRQRPGDDVAVGADRTNNSGKYEVKEKDAKGKFYAKAPRSTVVGSGECLEALSEKLAL